MIFDRAQRSSAVLEMTIFRRFGSFAILPLGGADIHAFILEFCMCTHLQYDIIVNLLIKKMDSLLGRIEGSSRKLITFIKDIILSSNDFLNTFQFIVKLIPRTLKDPWDQFHLEPIMFGFGQNYLENRTETLQR